MLGELEVLGGFAKQWFWLISWISGFHGIGGKVCDLIQEWVKFRNRGHSQRSQLIEIMRFAKWGLHSAKKSFEDFFAGLLAMKKRVGQERGLCFQIHGCCAEVFLAFVKPSGNFLLDGGVKRHRRGCLR
jgi:hypothetical protein